MSTHGPDRPVREPARRHSRRGDLAGEAKEREDPPRLPARRAALHASDRDHQHGHATAAGRSPCDHHLGTATAGAGSAAASKMRLRLAPLSSLLKHLAHRGAATRKSVVDVERPTINSDKGSTAAFSKAQARKILDAPADDTLAGLRDRAILAVGLQVGFRRAEIAALNVGDLHENRGFDTHRVTRKGGRRDALAINPQAAKRIRALRRWPNAAALPGTLAFPQGENATV